MISGWMIHRKEESVDITLEKDVLTVTGHVGASKPEGCALTYAEYDVGDYERAFTLSDGVDRDGISASAKDGVLRIVLPKAGPAKTKRIAVSAE
jgi:HSP20 family protein